MNDFSETEKELKTLQPAQPSAALFARIEEVLAGSEHVKIIRPNRFRVNWIAAGLGLAAAAALLLLARVGTDHTRIGSEKVAQISPATETTGPSEAATLASGNQFIPAGATQVVYNSVDEGLRFPNGPDAPMRRFHYETRETLHWRNPSTGESLRVSYPSDEVVLIPVSGQ